MKTTFNNREVQFEIEFGRHSTCDSFISTAWYLDGDMKELDNEEIDLLNEECQDIICKMDMEEFGYFRD